MTATIYNLETGRVTGIVESPDLATVLLNVLPGEAVIEGAYDPATTYFTGMGPEPLPPSPGDWAIWDGSEWIDPRTAADIAAALRARRAATWLDKSDLLIRLASFGILTPEEAEAAAGGAIPDSMAVMLATLPVDAQMAARVKWRADVQIGRNHPVIQSAAYALGLADTEVDEIFGIGGAA